jgi:hypothetical protein
MGQVGDIVLTVQTFIQFPEKRSGIELTAHAEAIAASGVVS